MRRKGRIEFTGESGLLILMKRIMKAQSRGIIVRSTMKSIVTSLIVWRPRMTDHIGKGLDVRERKEKNLIDRGDNKTSLIMTSLGTASLTQR
jgi:hypothetical protein